MDAQHLNDALDSLEAAMKAVRRGQKDDAITNLAFTAASLDDLAKSAGLSISPAMQNRLARLRDAR